MKLIREDRTLGWIVLVFALSQMLAIGWDLPGSYGWENDGIAPRDFFAGIAINLTPGQGHRYPLFHNVVLGLLCIPILLPAALRADEWTLPSLMEQILTVPVMTGCSLVAKLLSLLMACVALLVLARIARRTVSAQAGRWAAVWAATCLSFAYYGRVSNLDGPYLMWTVLAIDRLLAAADTGKRKDYILFGVLAGAAIATKDQAYAGFVLPGLIYVLLLPLRSDRPFGPRAAHYRNAAMATVAGAVFNPTGFLARLRELTGGASQDWMTYARTPSGVMANVTDIALGKVSLNSEPFCIRVQLTGYSWMTRYRGTKSPLWPRQRSPHGPRRSAQSPSGSQAMWGAASGFFSDPIGEHHAAAHPS